MARARRKKADGAPVRIRKNKKKLQSLVPTKLSKKPKAIRLSTLEYDPKIFETMKTDTIVDTFFSNKGGIPRACNFIVVGGPGSGKTTLGLDIIANVQNKNADKLYRPRVLFISGEMNEIDMYGYMERYPKFGEIDILFLGDYTEENPKLVIEEMLNEGYDLVLGDSFVEIQDTVKEACYMTTNSSEKWLIDLMCEHNKGNNKRKSYTTFLMIQQMTKGGEFVGSNKLKHNTTGMLMLNVSGEADRNVSRSVEFSKNRRGEVSKPLFFNLSTPNDITYNEAKWKLDKESEARMNKEMDQLIKEAEAFDTLLNCADVDPEAEEAAKVAAAEAGVLVGNEDTDEDEDNEFDED